MNRFDRYPQPMPDMADSYHGDTTTFSRIRNRIDPSSESGKYTVLGAAIGGLVLAAFCALAPKAVMFKLSPHETVEQAEAAPQTTNRVIDVVATPLEQFVLIVNHPSGPYETVLTEKFSIAGKDFTLTYPTSGRTVTPNEGVVILAEIGGKGLESYKIHDDMDNIDEETGQPHTVVEVDASKLWAKTYIADNYHLSGKANPAWMVETDVTDDALKEKVKDAETWLAGACGVVGHFIGRDTAACRKLRIVETLDGKISAVAETAARNAAIKMTESCITGDSNGAIKTQEEIKKQIAKAIKASIKKQRKFTKKQANALITVKFVDKHGNETPDIMTNVKKPYENVPVIEEVDGTHLSVKNTMARRCDAKKADAPADGDAPSDPPATAGPDIISTKYVDAPTVSQGQ